MLHTCAAGTAAPVGMLCCLCSIFPAVGVDTSTSKKHKHKGHDTNNDIHKMTMRSLSMFLAHAGQSEAEVCHGFACWCRGDGCSEGGWPAGSSAEDGGWQGRQGGCARPQAPPRGQGQPGRPPGHAPYMLFHTCYSIHAIPYILFHTCYSIHVIPYMPHYTCHTVHATLYMPHCSCHTVHATLYAPLRTCHYVCATPNMTLRTCHSVCATPYMALHTCHSIHAAPYMPLHTCQSMNLVPFPFLVTPRFSSNIFPHSHTTLCSAILLNVFCRCFLLGCSVCCHRAGNVGI